VTNLQTQWAAGRHGGLWHRRHCGDRLGHQPGGQQPG
jgi:hypothetical protein